jgi:hypothetical protein
MVVVGCRWQQPSSSWVLWCRSFAYLFAFAAACVDLLPVELLLCALLLQAPLDDAAAAAAAMMSERLW